MLAIILLVGSTVGAQIGARVSRRLKADQLKIILASIILLVMINIALGVVHHPAELFSFRGGH
jgi:hypothetical protein